ncbi:MAG TPA: AbgT family transporter, partial [Phycisphaerales bacterium]|nr:AbgT family transporter [Phycisphaerales bacterium]
MASTSIPPGGGFLGLVERVGNKLPEPVFLFLGATLLIMALSAVGSMLNWQVQPLRPQVVTEVETDHDGRRITRQVLNNQGRPVIELIPVGEPVRPRSLLDGQGIYWLISNLVRNFLNFPPLGVVVVSMFGIGVAEKVGLFGAAMKWVAGLVPSRLLTPTVVLLGVLSNIASDAGYIVLPPLAAGLYMVFGRPPLAGIAAAFAGIGGGFSANLLFGSTDVLVSGITEAGARTLDPSYSVLPTCNWYFMAASTVLIMFLAWAVTSWIVEPRLLATRHLDIPIPSLSAGSTISPIEARGLRWAGIGLAAALA